MTLNFNCICRLCLGQKERLMPLFGDDESLPARIMTFAPEIKMYVGDCLPSQICEQCIHQVNTSYNFKLQCESSDIALRQYLRNLNPQPESSYQDVSEGKESFPEHPSEDSGDECRLDSYDSIKLEVKDTFDNEEARLQNLGSQGRLQAGSSGSRSEDKFNALLNDSNSYTCKSSDSDSKVHKSCCSHVCGKDCSKNNESKKGSKRNSSLVNGTSEKKKRRNPRKRVVEEPVVKIEEDETKYSDPFDRFSNYDDDDDDSVEALPIIMEKERFVCNECGNVFAQKSGLLKHLRTHTGEKPFCCSMCGKTFRQSGNLTLHIRTHTGEKPFSCTECGESFGQSSTLTRHMRTHTGEKPFCCQVCGKSFGLRNTLTLHERSHMDDKPFHCTVCGKRFLRSSNLNEHMRTHTGEKPFQCTECGKSFVRRCDHKIHMRMHSGEKQFACTECGKCFLRSTELKIHMRLHTGEKPYSCTDCGKRFIRSNQLKRHRKTHMVIKPF